MYSHIMPELTKKLTDIKEFSLRTLKHRKNFRDIMSNKLFIFKLPNGGQVSVLALTNAVSPPPKNNKNNNKKSNLLVCKKLYVHSNNFIFNQ